MLWMLMMSFALASDCPWSYAPTTVTASGRMITVDGESFHAAGFVNVLNSCGEEEAAYHLMRWQTMRSASMGISYVGAVLIFPLLITPITGTIGLRARQKMTRELLDGEPSSP